MPYKTWIYRLLTIIGVSYYEIRCIFFDTRIANRRKNFSVLLASVFLFLALLDGWPYDFFVILRFVVFSCTIYVAWLSYHMNREVCIWIFGFIALIFNPFLPVHLSRDIWVVIDFTTGLFLFSSVFWLKFKNQE